MLSNGFACAAAAVSCSTLLTVAAGLLLCLLLRQRQLLWRLHQQRAWARANTMVLLAGFTCCALPAGLPFKSSKGTVYDQDAVCLLAASMLLLLLWHLQSRSIYAASSKATTMTYMWQLTDVRSQMLQY
jgi:hypothetical protein